MPFDGAKFETEKQIARKRFAQVAPALAAVGMIMVTITIGIGIHDATRHAAPEAATQNGSGPFIATTTSPDGNTVVFASSDGTVTFTLSDERNSRATWKPPFKGAELHLYEQGAYLVHGHSQLWRVPDGTDGFSVLTPDHALDAAEQKAWTLAGTRDYGPLIPAHKQAWLAFLKRTGQHAYNADLAIDP